jgi:hypothetical protein
MMSNEPREAVATEGKSFESALPDDIAAAVPAIVAAAMIRFGSAAMLVPRIPIATATPRLSRFDTAAMTTAASKSGTRMSVAGGAVSLAGLKRGPQFPDLALEH